MRAGQLRQRVTIQTNVGTQNAAGEVVDNWQDGETVWASVEPMRGDEFYKASREDSVGKYRIRMRYRTDVSTENRLEWVDGGVANLFDIEDVRNANTRDRQLIIMAKQVL